MKLLKTLVATSLFSVISCAESGPQKINVGKDQCENCKMTITEEKYAAELITQKGRIYKFDDVTCLNSYTTSNTGLENAKTYVADFPTGKFIEFGKATFIKGGSIKSPMGGNMQAYEDKAQAEKAKAEFGAN